MELLYAIVFALILVYVILTRAYFYRQYKKRKGSIDPIKNVRWMKK